MLKETDLYLPIKNFLQHQGFEVKSEIKGCDVVAQKEEQLVIVELKKSFNLELVLQGIERKSLTDYVYVAVPRPNTLKGSRWRKIKKLCKMLSLGLIFVAIKAEKSLVEVAIEPCKYTPNYNHVKRQSVEGEFNKRITDFNLGGSAKKPLLTAYKEDALLIALSLKDKEKLKSQEVKKITNNDKAAQVLRSNVYGWFHRVDRGVYALTQKGYEAINEHEYAIPYLLADAKGKQE